jgi:phosphoribosyl-AMP cyclohydrolase / phosphoribosyl-ATP pyrophosphohydrolase
VTDPASEVGPLPAGLDGVRFDDRGLIPAVCVDRERGAVLMLAWMNREALAATLASGAATFWSRSRGELWEKGATSGNRLFVREVRLDCDGDALLLVVEPLGPACHTGKPSCFFRPIAAGDAPPASAALAAEDDGPSGAPAAVVDRVHRVLEARRASGDGGTSYTAALLAAGWPKILAKLEEEQRELCAELPAGPDAKVVHEAVDLLFHMMVGLVARGVAPSALWRELERRFGTSGHAEKAARPPR